MEERLKKEVYPEGGYGWIIVISSSLSSFITLSILQSFGIVLKVTFAEMNLSATQTSLIVSMNGSFGMFWGPLFGILQKRYGCRKTAFLAASLTTFGMVSTSLCRSFTPFLIFYSIIASLGFQIAESTQRLAVSTYFKKKRSLVTGFILTFAGFAPIIIPQLLRFLLKIYTCHQTTLIYAGICTHLFICAALLQPVEWHLKKNEEMVKLNNSVKEATKRKIFELSLLKDPIFLNILLGVSLVTFAELNFTLLLPFILYEFGLNVDQVAIFLSVLGVADLISRFVSPYIGNYFNKSSRFMYALSVTILTITKTVFIFSCENYNTLLIVGFILGCAKGFRKVYMWLVVPDYVPLEKLPLASGIDMMCRGVFILSGGAFIGILRDVTGSYVACIFVMNGVVLLTLLFWTIEAFIVKFKQGTVAVKV